jgi:hypothetical protein
VAETAAEASNSVSPRVRTSWRCLWSDGMRLEKTQEGKGQGVVSIETIKLRTKMKNTEDGGKVVGKGWRVPARIGVWGLMMMGIGCTSVHPPHATHMGRHGTSGSALMCDRCKTTWVVRPEGSGRLVRYTKERAMVCPDCQSAAETWLKTGVFEHSCRHCGGRMTCETAK